MASEQSIALMRKAIRNLKTAVDVLSAGEREQLKDLIMKGQVSSEEELRAYLGRMIASRARARAKEKERMAGRQAAAKAMSEDALLEKQAKDDEEEATIETTGGRGGGASTSLDDEGKMSMPAKMTGKVIDAKSRKPLPFVKVRVQGTALNIETETTGTFVWEEMPRGIQIQFELTKKDYKTASVVYRATVDDEQHAVIKMVAIEAKGDKKKGGQGGGH